MTNHPSCSSKHCFLYPTHRQGTEIAEISFHGLEGDKWGEGWSQQVTPQSETWDPEWPWLVGWGDQQPVAGGLCASLQEGLTCPSYLGGGGGRWSILCSTYVLSRYELLWEEGKSLLWFFILFLKKPCLLKSPLPPPHSYSSNRMFILETLENAKGEKSFISGILPLMVTALGIFVSFRYFHM